LPRGRGESKPSGPRRPPATTLEGRENQLIALATDLAEQQMRDGTASSQVITHYLKLGTQRELIERDKLRSEAELAKAKVEALASQGRIEELYKNALDAMQIYKGQRPDSVEYDD